MWPATWYPCGTEFVERLHHFSRSYDRRANIRASIRLQRHMRLRKSSKSEERRIPPNACPIALIVCRSLSFLLANKAPGQPRASSLASREPIDIKLGAPIWFPVQIRVSRPARFFSSGGRAIQGAAFSLIENITTFVTGKKGYFRLALLYRDGTLAASPSPATIA